MKNVSMSNLKESEMTIAIGSRLKPVCGSIPGPIFTHGICPECEEKLFPDISKR